MRQSLGAGFSGLMCIGCGSPAMNGLIDKNGSPYVSCGMCRLRILGVSIEFIGGLRFFGEILRDPKGRAAWAAARGLTLENIPVLTPVGAPEVINEQR